MRRLAAVGLFSTIVACLAVAPPSAAGRPASSDPPARTDQAPHTNPRLRELLAGIAAAHACPLVRDTFTGLASSDQPNLVTGNLWIRDCSITASGTNVTFHFAGDGWQWVERKQQAAGGTFAVHQYVPFHVSATIRGSLDLAYAPETHVVTIWFKPTGAPQVEFKPLGKVAVDEQGTWSSIIGTLSSVVSQSPSQKATRQVAQQGAHAFASKLDDGLTVTVDACNGTMRTEFGHVPEGKMAPPGLGQAMKVAAALHPGGMLVIGPEVGDRGLKLSIAATSGPAHIEATCLDDADDVAQAFLANKPLPKVKTLASSDVDKQGSLEVPPAKCPVAIVARAQGGTATLSWTRTPRPGSALIQCGEPKGKKK